MLSFRVPSWSVVRASVIAALFVSSGIPTAFSQRVPRKPFPREPLEKAEDAPVYIYRTEVSPGMISQHDAFTSYQVNVTQNGQNILNDAANEPSIAMDPTNPNKMAIGWRQFNNVASSFRTAGWAFTTNGGTTWAFPGVLQINTFRSDPVLLADDAGIFFYLSLVSGFQDDIWRSPTGGMTWVRLAPATGGDKQWLTVDTSHSTGRGFLYQSWSTLGNNYDGRQFTRSTDGGFTWMDPIFIPHGPSWGTLDVDTDGNVFIGGADFSAG